MPISPPNGLGNRWLCAFVSISVPKFTSEHNVRSSEKLQSVLYYCAKANWRFINMSPCVWRTAYLQLKISLKYLRCCSLTQMYPTLWLHELQDFRLPCPSPCPRVCSNSCPLSWWCHSTISSSVFPFSSCLQSSQHPGLFQWAGSLHQVARVLELQLQHQSFQWRH